MDITIHDTIEADLPEIFRILTDPLVQPHQYKLVSSDTIDLWKQQLFGNQRSVKWVFKCTTIARHNDTIGHINQYYYEAYGQRICYCGWNIAPSYWGKGIALIALTQLFESLFGDHQIDAVVSDCFSNNNRCIRVMEKLNFKPGKISVCERMQTVIVKRCFHWILRFQLTESRWLARNANWGFESRLDR